MSEYSLIGNLETPTKKQFHTFEVALGIEKFNIAIPAEQVEAFESSVNSASKIDAEYIKTLVESLNGFLGD